MEEVMAERKSSASTRCVEEWKPVSSNRELGEHRDRKSAKTVRVRRKASRARSIGERVGRVCMEQHSSRARGRAMEEVTAERKSSASTGCI
jgi:hypothetical protein